LGVLLFHLWPNRLPGGFVGVDVFFVVSGFLITDHLIREWLTRGRVSLTTFWARRARRLIPASLLVLLATVVGVRLFVPDVRWGQFGTEIIASAFYVENWALAAQSVDYMALSNVKSPVQHFWTLGVEEQFYLLWPLLMVASLALARVLRRRSMVTLALVVGVVSAASLVHSTVSTAIDPSVAYFSTLTRAWEFGAGALLVFILRRHPVPFGGGSRAAAASWAGAVMIVTAMVVFTGSTPFPSFTALLPVIGTLLVIGAGTPVSPISPARLMALRPIQFVGDVSYGTYLWHWPLIVLLPYALGTPLGTVASVIVLFASIGLGWASKKFVEDPIRGRRIVADSKPRWTFAVTLVAMLGVTAAALPMATFRITAPSIPAVGQQADCYGAEAMLDTICGPAQDVALTAALSSFSVDLPPDDILACERPTTAEDYVRCDFGDEQSSGPRVALIGDSHATRLVEPLRETILAQNGTLSTFLVSGCSMMSNELTGSAWGYETPYAEQCRNVAERIHEAVAADPTIDTVILNNRTRLYVSPDDSLRPLTAAMVNRTIENFTAVGKRVVVIADPPEMSAVPPRNGGSAVDCLASATSPVECGLPRPQSEFPDPMSEAAKASGAGLIDIDDLFCTDQVCLPQIGGLVVYSDDNHLTRSFARSLVGPLAERLSPWISPGA
jgi:peptidoglycan/LPS O-acetylase OafA/YrhL